MRTYTFKFQDKERIITELDLMDPNFRLDLKRVQNMQNRGNAVVFCNCNYFKAPMKLSEHYPIPHFYNASEHTGVRHFKYCPHRLLDKNDNSYSPSVLLDEEGNKQFRLQKDRRRRLDIDYLGDDLKIRNDDYRFIYNNREDEIQEGRMSFEDFVRYCNQEYFVINQYTNKAGNIAEFNRALYGYIMAQKVNRGNIEKFLCGNFYYKVLNEIKVGKRNTTLTNEDNKKWFVPNPIFKKSCSAFKKQYGLEIYQAFNKPDYKVVMFGSKGKKKIDDGRIITDILSIELALVNNDGLFLDCISQARVFNRLCEKAKGSAFIIERPNEPRDYYKYNPNLICDCVVRHKELGLISLIEVFEKKGTRYDKIKDNKLKQVKYPLISYDPDSDSLNEVLSKIDDLFVLKEKEEVKENKEEKKEEIVFNL